MAWVGPRCPIETTFVDVCGFSLTFFSDQWEVLVHVLKGFLDGLQRNLEFVGEFLGSAGIGTVNGLIDDCGAYAPALEKQLPVVGSRTVLQVLVRSQYRG